MRRLNRLLVIGSDSHYGREVTRGIHRYCRQQGLWEYSMVSDNSPEAAKRAQAAIRQWGATGIIAVIRSRRIEQLVRNSRVPVVNVSAVREADVPTVICDFIAAGRIAARHFLDNGFRNFAFYSQGSEQYVFQMCQGFLGELSGAGFDCKVFMLRDKKKAPSGWIEIRRMANQWLRKVKTPVAIMCVHDASAQIMVWNCRRLGLHVPDDVAIIGTGNQEIICQMCAPPLSSVDFNIQRIGYEAARLLHGMIQGRKPPTRPILVSPWRVVTRQSSDMVAVDDPEIAAAMRFIRNHAHEPITIKDLMRDVHMSRRTLERRFAKLIGRMPAAELTRIRTERAKALLMETEMSIPSVAQGSGFMSRTIFAGSFRRQTGLTPSEFRRNSRLEGSNHHSASPERRTRLDR